MEAYLVSGSSCQVLALSVGNVLPGPVVSVLLSKSKVDQEEFLAVTPTTRQEIVWLNVTMIEILVVDVFNSSNHLIRQHEDSLQLSFTATSSLLAMLIPR